MYDMGVNKVIGIGDYDMGLGWVVYEMFCVFG